jgi:uncharacterized membrane protein YfcA
MFAVFISIMLGLISGFFTGFTGISSAGIMLAGLSFTNVIKDYKTLIGTILYLLMFPITSGSAWEFYKLKKINFFIGNILLVSFFTGSFLGSQILLNSGYKISEKTIKYITSGIALFMFIYFFNAAYVLP